MKRSSTKGQTQAKPSRVQDTPTFAPLQQQSPSERPRRFWLLEIWNENREAFKELVKHLIFFLLIAGALPVPHKILALLGLLANQQETFDKVHFYAAITLLIMFSGITVIKLLMLEFKRPHK